MMKKAGKKEKATKEKKSQSAENNQANTDLFEKQDKEFSAGIHALASIGEMTEKVASDFIAKASIKKCVTPEILKIMTDNFNQKSWNDPSASRVLSHYFKLLDNGKTIDVNSLNRWILSHPDDSNAVIDCLNTSPPEQIEIIKVLSRAGSQKLVFLATWRPMQRQVVLKLPLGSQEQIKKVLERESQSHPFSSDHDNIIKTYVLKNGMGDIFLAEERVTVLNDELDFEVSEAANLLYDIANALNYLHVTCRKIHGDVKPDNIGKGENGYILLDFGMCRFINEMDANISATGSLRTRAPELLINSSYTNGPSKADVWALGATVFKGLTGRFPLFNNNEIVPRISSPNDRAEFETKLTSRVNNEWTKWMDLSKVPESMRSILGSALEKDPEKRCDAKNLMEEAGNKLRAFVRNSSKSSNFSPSEELRQMRDYLPFDNKHILKLMPDSEKEILKKKLGELKGALGFEKAQISQVELLLTKLD